MHRNMSILYVKSGMNIGENEGGFKTCSANDSIVVKDGNKMPAQVHDHQIVVRSLKKAGWTIEWIPPLSSKS
jgi:hypothetical protein